MGKSRSWLDAPICSLGNSVGVKEKVLGRYWGEGGEGNHDSCPQPGPQLSIFKIEA